MSQVRSNCAVLFYPASGEDQTVHLFILLPALVQNQPVLSEHVQGNWVMIIKSIHL